MKASIIVTRHHSDQVIMQSPQGVEVKRNLQHLKPLEIPESDYSTGDNPDQPDQLSSPDHVAPNPQEPSETMESVPTATPRHSGRVSHPPRALEDYVLE